MKRYDSYKDSGVEWIGEIPTEWEITKLKFSDLIIMGQSPKSEECNQEGIGLPFIQGNAEFGELHPTPKLFCDAANKIAKVNDILFSVRAPIGAVNIANANMGIGRGLCAIRTVESNYKYLYYYSLFMADELNSLGTGSTFKAVTAEDVKCISIPKIPFKQQTQIAKYLDKKTTQIDKLITDKQKLIELLNEERTVMINQAVTKGLNPNVPMKDSGIEWVGEIPKHWKVWKLAHAFSKIGGGTTPESGNPIYHENGTINWLNTGDLNDGVLNETSKKITKKALQDYSALKTFPPHSVVIAMYGATIGKTSLVNCEITTNQACCVFYGSEIIKNEYLFNWFLSNKSNIINLSKGGGQPNVSMEILKSLKVPCPTKEEQNIIIDFIETESHKIGNLLLKVYQEIDLLKEYKTALISEVVTGKVDVRDELIGSSHAELISASAFL